MEGVRDGCEIYFEKEKSVGPSHQAVIVVTVCISTSPVSHVAGANLQAANLPAIAGR